MYFNILVSVILSESEFLEEKGKHRENYIFTGSCSMKSFSELWQKMRLPIESAIRQSLINMYGRGEMNVFVKSKPIKMSLTRGFLVSDNIVQALIIKPTMRELPMIIAPEVHLALDGNSMRVEGILRKIFIDAEYMLFRNHSDIQYTNLDPEKSSPFSSHQVHDIGSVAITAEGCNFLGSAIVTLLGSSVKLGLHTFRVQDCKFNIEIFTEGLGMTPVMAPYFNKLQSTQLEALMTIPIADEMNTKIQSALISYVNTSAIFGNKLPKFIYEQRKIFRKCALYLEKMVRKTNAAVMKTKNEVLRFNDHSLTWNDKAIPEGKSTITIKDLVVSGLDTTYSINRGGPYKLKDETSIAEDFYFHTLIVQGKFVQQNGIETFEYNFGGEILDVQISIKVEISVFQTENKNTESEKKKSKFVTVSARGFELAIPEIGDTLRERITVDSFILGHIYNTVPQKLVQVLAEILPNAVNVRKSKKNIKKELKYKSDYKNDQNDDDTDSVEFIAMGSVTEDDNGVKSDDWIRGADEAEKDNEDKDDDDGDRTESEKDVEGDNKVIGSSKEKR